MHACITCMLLWWCHEPRTAWNLCMRIGRHRLNTKHTDTICMLLTMLMLGTSSECNRTLYAMSTQCTGARVLRPMGCGVLTHMGCGVFRPMGCGVLRPMGCAMPSASRQCTCLRIHRNGQWFHRSNLLGPPVKPHRASGETV